MISKFIERTASIIPRFVVLNSEALFVYKDELAFQSFPNKPTVVIPIGEIANVKVETFGSKELLRNN